jgi:hypothetical protein
MVYWYIGVASFPNKDRELLEVLQPLRLVVLRLDERQQQEEAAAHGRYGSARCRRIGGAAPARRWRRAAVAVQVLAAPQAKAIMPLSLAQILCGLP